MVRRPVPIVLVLLALASSSMSSPQGPPPGLPMPPGPGPGHLAFVLEAIDLTPQQEAQIGPLLDARREAGDSSRAATEAALRGLADQIRSATFDEAAIRAKAAALAALEADRAVADAALLRDARSILTTEQRAKFDRLMTPGEGPGAEGPPR